MDITPSIIPTGVFFDSFFCIPIMILAIASGIDINGTANNMQDSIPNINDKLLSFI